MYRAAQASRGMNRLIANSMSVPEYVTTVCRNVTIEKTNRTHMKKVIVLLLLAGAGSATAQEFTRQDTLRGSITPERRWWDVLHYNLQVRVNPSDSSIEGSNTIRYKVVTAGNPVMQIDLQDPMVIDKVVQADSELPVRHEGNAHFVELEKAPTAGEVSEVTVYYHGNPRVAVNAPWDGGFSWKKDSLGNHFIATSNQGLGASVWWPCKDHMYDENDQGMSMSYTVPENSVAVGNGRLKSVTKGKDKTKTYTWEVLNPINNYGVNLNVGNYVSFSEKYKGEKGMLDMDFWVLEHHLQQAKIHFRDAARTLEAFEYWFGPYPFYEDSYKLVEVPYLGMEHQSSVTYGNDFKKGYKGYDLSGTGWGLKWDYIIIHETGHEWFANNITYKDIADMWIHESFTCYSENLFIEYFYGPEAAAEYVQGTRKGIQNRESMIGNYGVNDEGADLYNKGANMLHTLRQLVNDDEKWREILRGLNKEFYHQTVSTEQIENYIASQSGLDLSAFFDQYLRDPRVPVLEYFTKDTELFIRWTNCIRDFAMPVDILVGGEVKRITPVSRWEKAGLKIEGPLIVDPDFYIYNADLTVETTSTDEN